MYIKNTTCQMHTGSSVIWQVVFFYFLFKKTPIKEALLILNISLFKQYLDWHLPKKTP